MNTGNVFLDNLFNGLSSIYRTDDGMVHSNLFTVFNADAEVFQDIQRKIDQIADNRYIATADPDALEANFGLLIDFPKPPRLNTLTNGDEIYRAMVRSLFKVFQSGSTNAAMNQALDTAVSFLTIDPRVEDAVTVVNYTYLLTVDNDITLSWDAIQPSGSFVVGPARPQDIEFFPSDIIPVAYDPNNRIVSFTGTINTGTQYQVIYSRDNRSFRGTNWINISDSTAQSPSPFTLSSGNIGTYNNPEFSYWWSTFNADGNGVVIDEFKITRQDSSLAWRLPEKTIQFISPYSGEVLTRTIEFYNLSGTAYDIEHLDSVNLDSAFSDKPLNYYTDVSPLYTNYYIRYSNNNTGPAAALSQFNGALPKFLKKFQSIEFTSDNFGTLDFFEKTSGFDTNDIFGTGTRNVWLNVPNVNGKYILSNEELSERSFSLHERILFQENFESGQLNRIGSTYPSGTTITDLVGVPFFDKEDCLMLMSPAASLPVSASPIITGNAIQQTNRVQVDFFDPLNSGTNTFIDVIRTGTSASDYNRFRFGIDSDILGIDFSSSDPLASSKTFGFVETYFNDTTSTARTVNVGDFISSGTASYVFVTGTNPNVLFSNTSLRPTGIAGGKITPNAPTGLIANADRWIIEFTNTGTAASAGFNISMQNYTSLGTFAGVPKYGHEVINFYMGGAGVWEWQHIQDVVVDGLGNTTLSFVGGVTAIPIATGLNTLEMIKGSGTILNGNLYTTQFPNPGKNWGNLGVAPNGGGPLNTVSIGDPNSLEIISDGNKLFQHYDLQNDGAKQDFEEKLDLWPVISNSTVPYFYQIFTDPNNKSAPKVFLNQFPRNFGWNRLTIDFGTKYSGTTATFGESVFFNNPSVGFSGTLVAPSGIAMINTSELPTSEFSYFDNVKASYYDASQTLPEYQTAVILQEDWQGSALSESTIIDNKFFELDPQPNFQFNVLIKGLDESFIFIINKIIEKLKPAHTIATSIFEQDQSLDTTSQVPIVSSTGTDWETGNIMNNIIIKPTGESTSPTNDLPGLITISGNTP